MNIRSIKSLVLATILGVAAVVVVSGPADAHAVRPYHYGWHYGWHKGWHQHSYVRYDMPVGVSSCYRKQWVWTDYGYRWEWANTCNTGLGLFGIF